MILLFNSQATSFITNGLGNLSDAISCTITEEYNSGFELELEYPITGIHYQDLGLRKIIVTKSTPYSTPQAFRIYGVSKVISGVVTFEAHHISYDLSGYPVSPFTSVSIQEAFLDIKSSSVISCPFTFTTDKSSIGSIAIIKPVSIRSILGSEILTSYGGDYEFDNFNVRLWNNRGLQRGVSIRYGKNLIDLKQEENCSNVYTGVYPYWYSEQEGLVQLTEKVLTASGTYDFTRILPLDMSSLISEVPTEDILRAGATTYMTTNNIGIPTISIDVNFAQLSQSEEYKHFSILETVTMGDSVKIEFSKLGVNAVAKCIKTTYNAITNKYDEIGLGDYKSNLAATINDNVQLINTTITEAKSELQLAIDHATEQITSSLGGYVVKRNGELLIMDTEDVMTAVKVWRWNQNGLGYSAVGYNGPFRTAITADGHIVADFIDTGDLTANVIKTGLLSSFNNKINFNLDTGTFNLDDKLTFDGSTLSFGNNVVLKWANLDAAAKTNLTGSTGAIGPQGVQGPQGYPGSNANVPSWVTNTTITGLGVSAPFLQGNRIYTSAENDSWLYLAGATMSFHKLVGGVDKTLFTIGTNMDGSSAEGIGQIFLSDGCSIDTVGGSIRLRTSTTNYIRVNSLANGGGVDYINGSTTTSLLNTGSYS